MRDLRIRKDYRETPLFSIEELLFKQRQGKFLTLAEKKRIKEDAEQKRKKNLNKKKS